MLVKWGVMHFFRAAYSGNGVAERHHWIIKAAAKKSRISPQEAVFWYMLPKMSQDADFLPQRAVFKYEWQYPRAGSGGKGEESTNIRIGVG